MSVLFGTTTLQLYDLPRHTLTHSGDNTYVHRSNGDPHSSLWVARDFPTISAAASRVNYAAADQPLMDDRTQYNEMFSSSLHCSAVGSADCGC